jgi:hypothetical protein
MTMDDALLNCMTGVCCPPAAQATALAEAMVKEGVCGEPNEAHEIAKWMIKHFDFAEAGTLAPLRASILRLHKAKK